MQKIYLVIHIIQFSHFEAIIDIIIGAVTMQIWTKLSVTKLECF